MKDKVVFLRDIMKRLARTHTLDSATVFTHEQDEEISDEDLERVCGGMSREVFDVWKVNLVNRRNEK